MRLTYWQRLARGWGMLLDLVVVVLLWQVLILVAFLPCYALYWVGTLAEERLSEAVQTAGLAVIAAYGLLVGPAVLYYLVQCFGYPWRWLKDPARAARAGGPVTSVVRAGVAGQDAQPADAGGKP
jgi:hypothetical protein